MKTCSSRVSGASGRGARTAWRAMWSRPSLSTHRSEAVERDYLIGEYITSRSWSPPPCGAQLAACSSPARVAPVSPQSRQPGVFTDEKWIALQLWQHSTRPRLSTNAANEGASIEVQKKKIACLRRRGAGKRSASSFLFAIRLRGQRCGLPRGVREGLHRRGGPFWQALDRYRAVPGQTSVRQNGRGD